MNNKNHPEGEKQAGRKKTGAQSNMKLTWRKSPTGCGIEYTYTDSVC